MAESAEKCATTSAALAAEEAVGRVKMNVLTAALASVEADLERSIAAVHAQRLIAVDAMKAASTTATAAAAEGRVMRSVLADTDAELACSRSAHAASMSAYNAAAEAAASAEMAAATLQNVVGECEDEAAEAARSIRAHAETERRTSLSAVEHRHAQEIGAARRTAAELALARDGLREDVEQLEAAMNAAGESHKAEAARLNLRVDELEGHAFVLRNEQEAEALRFARREAALQSDKEAATQELSAQLAAVVESKQREEAALKNKVARMKSLQSAALAAGSVRGRQRLYAENLKQRRIVQALSDPVPTGAPSATAPTPETEACSLTPDAKTAATVGAGVGLVADDVAPEEVQRMERQANTIALQGSSHSS